MKLQHFVADVRKAMPSNGIIALDNGVFKVWFARNYLAAEPNTVLLDNAPATPCVVVFLQLWKPHAYILNVG